MRKIVIGLMCCLLLTPVCVSAREYDLSQLYVVDYDGNANLEECIQKEDEIEEKVESAIDVFWDVTLKDGATEEQIREASNLIAKVCYMPKREEYNRIINIAYEMLFERDKAEGAEQSKVISSIVQSILLIYNPETGELNEDVSVDDIMNIYNRIDEIKNIDTRLYYAGLVDEMFWAKQNGY